MTGTLWGLERFDVHLAPDLYGKDRRSRHTSTNTISVTNSQSTSSPAEKRSLDDAIRRVDLNIESHTALQLAPSDCLPLTSPSPTTGSTSHLGVWMIAVGVWMSDGSETSRHLNLPSPGAN